MPMTHGVELLLSLDKRDIPAFKLIDSPKGSNCVELIGSNCKCGPFTIRNSKGFVQANTPYEITGPAGTRRGCTDSKGDTIAVESSVTGPCHVRLFPQGTPFPECEDGNVAASGSQDKGK